jgi:hypothetical protein
MVMAAMRSWRTSSDVGGEACCPILRKWRGCVSFVHGTVPSLVIRRLTGLRRQSAALAAAFCVRRRCSLRFVGKALAACRYESLPRARWLRAWQDPRTAGGVRAGSLVPGAGRRRRRALPIAALCCRTAARPDALFAIVCPLPSPSCCEITATQDSRCAIHWLIWSRRLTANNMHYCTEVQTCISVQRCKLLFGGCGQLRGRPRLPSFLKRGISLHSAGAQGFAGFRVF